MRIAILQPSYLAWLGAFEQMAYVDHFVYYNDVQYTKGDWRNRNRIKTQAGATWLTVPVKKAPHDTLISEIEIAYQEAWPEKHLRKIDAAYRKAPYFEPFFSRLSEVLLRRCGLLQDLNRAVTELCASFLEVDTPTSWSSDLGLRETGKNERLLAICRALGADLLYDGAAAAEFIRLDYFAGEGVRVVFQEYAHPVYRQQWGEFVSHLSAIDLIMNMGPDAPRLLRSSPRAVGVELQTGK
jgi:hypothetical protein